MNYKAHSKRKLPKPKGSINPPQTLIDNNHWTSKSKNQYLSNHSISGQRVCQKNSEKYLGPYEIIAQPSPQSFTLCLPDTMRAVHPVFHISMLKPATPNTFQQRSEPPPAPVIIDREPEYKISKIVDSKIDCRRACKLLYCQTS